MVYYLSSVNVTQSKRKSKLTIINQSFNKIEPRKQHQGANYFSKIIFIVLLKGPDSRL